MQLLADSLQQLLELLAYLSMAFCVCFSGSLGGRGFSTGAMVDQGPTPVATVA